MKKLNILTDSMCHIPTALCQELEIHVVPLPFVWDGLEGRPTQLSGCPVHRSRPFQKGQCGQSGPTPGSLKEHFEAAGRHGKPVLAILHGRQFSSTLNAAELALDLVPAGKVTLYDSASMATGLGFQVLAAARLAMQGTDLAQVLSLLDRIKSACGMVFATA